MLDLFAVMICTCGSSTATTSYSDNAAYCCAHGFTVGNPGPYVRDALAARGIDMPAYHQDIRATPDGIRAHQTWQIRWAESDIESLSPAPPTLTCREKRLATWVPGSAPTDEACCPDPNNDSGSLGNLIYFVTIPRVGRRFRLGLSLLLLLLPPPTEATPTMQRADGAGQAGQGSARSACATYADGLSPVRLSVSGSVRHWGHWACLPLEHLLANSNRVHRALSQLRSGVFAVEGPMDLTCRSNLLTNYLLF